LVIQQNSDATYTKRLETSNPSAVNFGKFLHHSQGFKHKLERVWDVSLTRFSISCFKSVTIWKEFTSKGNFSFTITMTKVETVMYNTAPSAAQLLSSKQLKFHPQE
jgi:hypothetical protein